METKILFISLKGSWMVEVKHVSVRNWIIRFNHRHCVRLYNSFSVSGESFIYMKEEKNRKSLDKRVFVRNLCPCFTDRYKFQIFCNFLFYNRSSIFLIFTVILNFFLAIGKIQKIHILKSVL